MGILDLKLKLKIWIKIVKLKLYKVVFFNDDYMLWEFVVLIFKGEFWFDIV